MADAPVIGGGVAPGVRGAPPKRTKVRKVPFWVPWDHEGAGSWRLIPADTAHTAMLIDENNQATRYYEAKGFVPEQYAPPEKLPLLVEKARTAIKKADAEAMPRPEWALGVLGRHDAKKVPAGADAA